MLIYADNFYEEIPDGETPAVVMNIPESSQLQKTDLSELTERLGDWYITDMAEFHDSIPLSWSIPEHTITEAVYFYHFLEHPELAVVPESNQLAFVESYSETSGAVRMIPISEQHKIQKNYHDYCCVNADADKKHQRIGMLWISLPANKCLMGLVSV